MRTRAVPWWVSFLRPGQSGPLYLDTIRPRKRRSVDFSPRFGMPRPWTEVHATLPRKRETSELQTALIWWRRHTRKSCPVQHRGNDGRKDDAIDAKGLEGVGLDEANEPP